MKRLIVITVQVILLCIMSFGQKYEPFISESKQWTYVQTVYLTGGDGANYLVEKGYFKGDTIWNDVKYSKFYKEQLQPTHWGKKLSYFFREDIDTKKVYVHDVNFNKTALLYDFNLNKGDYFNIYVLSDIFLKVKVLKVDTIVTNNKRLKRIEFEDSITWIEGLGSVTGMYIPSSGELICVKDGNSVLYLNSKFNNCDTVFQQDFGNAINDLKAETPYGFYVYPNPVEASSVLKVKANANCMFEIEIYNSLGILIREDRFVDNYQIGLIHLNKGLYVYRLKCNNAIVGIDKLIVK